MSSSVNRWQSLPAGLLKAGYSRWCRLEEGVQRVIVELAEDQQFKCALCSKSHLLEIEHDHDPEHGDGDLYTIYNVRGLVCRGCNWRIMMYEKEERGEYTSWECYTKLRHHEYGNYIYNYKCRVGPLIEAALENRMGLSYWRRRRLLEQFDDWNEGSDFPWRWGFDEIKEKRHGKIRTPKQFFQAFIACTNFIKEQRETDPTFQPPHKYIEVLCKMKRLLDEIRPSIEGRLKVQGRELSPSATAAP